MADDRDPKPCPKCGQVCVYDGWDHVHANGIGIGSCGGLVAGMSMAINTTGEPERVMSKEELRAAIENMAIERQLRRDRKHR